MKQQWGYSINGEDFKGADTLGQACGEATDQLERDHEPGTPCEYQVGQYVHPIAVLKGPLGHNAIRGEYLANRVLELVNEMLADEIGGEDDALEMNPIQKQVFARTLFMSLNANTSAKRYGISNVVTYHHIAGEEHA